MSDVHLNVGLKPVDKANPVPTSDALGAGTRLHPTDSLFRRNLGAASATEPLPTLGASREIYVMPNVRGFFRTGLADVTAAPGTSHPVATDERFYVQVPVGHTHIAFVRDTVDGQITVCAVS